MFVGFLMLKEIEEEVVSFITQRKNMPGTNHDKKKKEKKEKKKKIGMRDLKFSIIIVKHSLWI